MITVLTGNNAHALRKKLGAIKSEFKELHGAHAVEVYNGEQLEPTNLDSIFAGVSLFATNRLVIIEDISQNRAVAELIAERLSLVPDTIHLVLVERALDKRTIFYKALKKEADFQEFAELDEQAATAWISEQIKKEGGEISSAAMRLLVRYAGTDQSRLAGELAKLLAYDQTVTEATIEELVEKNPEETIFQLLDFALAGRTDQALKVLEGLEIAHEDPFQAANMLIWQAHILAIVTSADNYSDNEIAKGIKVNPFVVKKTRGLARRLSSKQLNKIIDTTAEFDVKLKTTSANPWRLLEATILAFQ